MSWDRAGKMTHFSTLFKIVTFLDSLSKLSLFFRRSAFYDKTTAMSDGSPPCDRFARPFVAHISISEAVTAVLCDPSFLPRRGSNGSRRLQACCNGICCGPKPARYPARSPARHPAAGRPGRRRRLRSLSKEIPRHGPPHAGAGGQPLLHHGVQRRTVGGQRAAEDLRHQFRVELSHRGHQKDPHPGAVPDLEHPLVPDPTHRTIWTPTS